MSSTSDDRVAEALAAIPPVSDVEVIEPAEAYQLHGDVEGVVILGGGDVSDVDVSEWLENPQIRPMLRDEKPVLVFVEGVVLDIGAEPPEAYFLSVQETTNRPEQIAEGVEQVLIDQLDPQPLDELEDPTNIIEALQEANLLSYQTSTGAAALMATWATTGEPGDILDVACGTGQLLQTVGQTIDDDPTLQGFELHGVDISRFATMITRQRLQTTTDTIPLHIEKQDFFDLPTPPQTTLQTTLDTEPDHTDDDGQTFTAVVGHPPSIRIEHASLSEEERDRIGQYLPRGRLDQAFVLKAVEHLQPDGRGAFVLPLASLTAQFVEKIMETATIDRIIKLPEKGFLAASLNPVLLFLEGHPQAESEIGLVRIDSSSLEEIHHHLLQWPNELLESREGDDRYAATTISPDDVDHPTLKFLLQVPEAAPLIHSEDYPSLGTAMSLISGVKTGANDFFYLDAETIDDYEIADDLLTPVVKDIDPDLTEITRDNITVYLLDFRRFATVIKDAETAIPELIDVLEEEGYSGAAAYVEAHRGLIQRPWEAGLPFLPDYIPEQTPDLVARKLSSTPHWQLITTEEDVVVDNTLVGLHTPDIKPQSLATLLNTSLYQNMISELMPQLSVDPSYARIRQRELRKLPLIESFLNENCITQLADVVPARTPDQRNTIQSILLEQCEQGTERQVVNAALEAFAPSELEWYLDGDQLEEFRDRIEAPGRDPGDYLRDQFGDEAVKEMRQTISYIGFLDDRRAYLHDLLDVFADDRHRAFALGIATQFEGVLVDFVEATGGNVFTKREEVNGEPHEYRYFRPGETLEPVTDAEEKTKSLKTLIDAHFQGTFHEFMETTIKETRNKLAHGELVPHTDEKSVILLVGLYSSLHNLLHQYNKYLTQHPDPGQPE